MVAYMTKTPETPDPGSSAGSDMDAASAYVRRIEYRRGRFETFQAKADEEKRQLRVLVQIAVANGYCSELQASKLAGVTRDTVRRWLGK